MLSLCEPWLVQQGSQWLDPWRGEDGARISEISACPNNHYEIAVQKETIRNRTISASYGACAAETRWHVAFPCMHVLARKETSIPHHYV